ncbi:MAG: hypothetical protein MK116_04635 [Phycisphaerales bacterium]|nr:hypothetical protein [Phycisphaerales bacterium]
MARFLSILANPTSAKATGKADQLEQALERSGWTVNRTTRAPGEPVDRVAERVEGSEVLVLVGGDGTVRLLADVAAATGIPIWHHSGGNENLFARSLGMAATPAALEAALEQRVIHRVDRLQVGTTTSLLMVSSGFDAEIVKTVSDNRTGAVSNLNYLWPMVQVMFRWKAARYTIDVDGERRVTDGRGWVIVANSPDYAARFDPVPGALMDDGRLDVLFVPMRGMIGMIDWIVRCRLRLTRFRNRLLRGRNALEFRGHEVTIQSNPGTRWQVDGDTLADGPMSSVTVTTERAAIPVLLPARDPASLRVLSRF